MKKFQSTVRILAENINIFGVPSYLARCASSQRILSGTDTAMCQPFLFLLNEFIQTDDRKWKSEKFPVSLFHCFKCFVTKTKTWWSFRASWNPNHINTRVLAIINVFENGLILSIPECHWAIHIPARIKAIKPKNHYNPKHTEKCVSTYWAIVLCRPHKNLWTLHIYEEKAHETGFYDMK